LVVAIGVDVDATDARPVECLQDREGAAAEVMREGIERFDQRRAFATAACRASRFCPWQQDFGSHWIAPALDLGPSVGARVLIALRGPHRPKGHRVEGSLDPLEVGLGLPIVQARLRHSSAKTTLNPYEHLWPDSDESTRTAIDAVMQERAAKPESGSVAKGLPGIGQQ